MMPARNRGGRPTLADLPRRNEHLLDIATRNFVRLGYSGATIDGIAAEAGVAKRTIYARYPDKQALFFAVMKRLGERRILDVLPPDDDLPPAEGLARRAHAILDRALTPEELTITRMTLVELNNFPDLGKILWKAVEDEHGARLTEYFRAQQAKGRIRDLDPAWLAEHFMFNIFSLTNQVALYEQDVPDSAAVDRFIARLVDVLLRGIAA